VVSRFEIKRPERFFTRCLVCNTPLQRATDEQVDAQVPGNVRSRHDDFRYCPNCHKVYWAGSHTNRMLAAIESIFKGEEE
jgi:uncharacterized protein with PIN domain